MGHYQTMGRLTGVRRYYEECTYFGSAPVSLAGLRAPPYQAQTIAGQVVTAEELKNALSTA